VKKTFGLWLADNEDADVKREGDSVNELRDVFAEDAVEDDVDDEATDEADDRVKCCALLVGVSGLLPLCCCCCCCNSCIRMCLRNDDGCV
jgi:hypothetical protein